MEVDEICFLEKKNENFEIFKIFKFLGTNFFFRKKITSPVNCFETKFCSQTFLNFKNFFFFSFEKNNSIY